jgi:hypothetical protein
LIKTSIKRYISFKSVFLTCKSIAICIFLCFPCPHHTFFFFCFPKQSTLLPSAVGKYRLRNHKNDGLQHLIKIVILYQMENSTKWSITPIRRLT